MHKIHITDGMVLAKYHVGEASTASAILTRESGLVRARATSARLALSKLKYGLEPLTAGTFSFVKGKSGWRLTSITNVRRLVPAHLFARATAGRITKLLTRLIHGEEVALALYEAVLNGLELLCTAQEREEVESLECVLVLRILFNLGYLPKTEFLTPFVEQGLSLELAAHAARSRSALIRTINESLQATGL